MTVGFISISDSGNYQIDENTTVLSFISTNSISSLTSITPKVGNGFGNTIAYSGTYVGDYPLIALYIPLDSGYFGGVTYTNVSGGSTWTFEIHLFDNTDYGTKNLSLCKYILLARPQVTSSSGAGLEIYDDSGKLRYSSLFKPKTIAGGADVTINSSKRYAFLGGKIEYEATFDIDQLTDLTFVTNEAHYATGLYSGTGGVFQLNRIVYTNTYSSAGGSGYTDTFGSNQPGLAVDVTEYT